jgi:hypothetical protein
MEGFGRDFIQGMKSKINVELIGPISVQVSAFKGTKKRTGALPSALGSKACGGLFYKQVLLKE